MPEDFEKMKQEQERKRALWREKQKAKIGEKLSIREPVIQKTAEPEEELPEGRSPRAIMVRLRAAQAKERTAQKTTKQKALESLPGGEVAARIREWQQTMKRLKTIYRIINGASGITLVGLIITFLIMNAQLFLGNLMKMKFIPELDWPEILILLFVDFIVGMAILIFILFISFLIGSFVK
ncbi:hypothetical protein J7K86_01830 [bacterium]|nr:hypothetical protein [bacterium]